MIMGNSELYILGRAYYAFFTITLNFSRRNLLDLFNYILQAIAYSMLTALIISSQLLVSTFHTL